MKRQRTYYVEVYRPAYPQHGVHLRVHKAPLNKDWLSPALTALWKADHVSSAEEAIAIVIEKAAGKPTTAHQVI